MLTIFSGEVPELNAILLEKLGPKHTITTIPASPSDMASAKHFTDYFRHAGLRARLQSARFYRDAKKLKNIINNSDAVYLMGGNTFDFLAYAQRVNLFPMLEHFEANGGIIIGESAGSIILSPNIATALIPTTCPDDHIIELGSYKGMGRIPFHISPHFHPDADVSQNELNELQALAHISKCPVVVLQDGEGLVIEGKEITQKIGQPKILDSETAPPASIDSQAFLPTWAAEV